MNRPFFTTLALLGILSLRLCSLPETRQETNREGMLVDYVNLVALNVIPSAATGNQALPKLSVADLKVTDHGQRVEIRYFSGPNGQNEPVLLWLVADCRTDRSDVSQTPAGR